MSSFDQSGVNGLIGLWEFANGNTNGDTGLDDGLAQNGTFENGASAAGGRAIFDGHNDRFDVDGDHGGPLESEFDLDRGVIETQFTSNPNEPLSNATIVNRGEFKDMNSEGWFGIRITGDGKVIVQHCPIGPDGTRIDAFLDTPAHFYSAGDTINVNYEWDATTGATATITNITTGETFTETKNMTGLTLDIGDNDDEIFTFGAREENDGHYDQHFDGTIDYVAVYDSITPPADPDGIVDGEEFAEEMVLGYDDANDPTDNGGDLITNGDDIIRGNGGNDTINGAGGNDFIEGNAGDDVIQGGQGNDTVLGGSGDDTIGGASGDDVIFGGAGNDMVEAAHGDDTIYGGQGNDDLWASHDDDFVDGGTGDDKVVGGKGNDELYGGEGDDTIKAGSDDDTAFGGDGDDLILGDARFKDDNGQPGDDELYGDAGNDTIEGEDGDDLLVGGQDDDHLQGGAGNDTLDGVDGSSRVATGDNLLVNGGLNSGQAAGTFSFGPIPGWTNGGQRLERWGDGYDDTPGNVPVAAVEGDSFAELDVDTAEPDELSQTVATTSGDVYELTFSAQQRIDTSDDEIEIYWGGQLIDVIVPGAEWTEYTYTVTGSGSDTLTFREPATDNNSFGPLIDDVSLRATEIVEGESGNDKLLGGADEDLIFADGGDTVDGGAGGFDADPANNTDHDVLDLTGQGPFILAGPNGTGAPVADSNGNGLDGTVIFVDTDGNPTGETIPFTEIEEIRGDNVTNEAPDVIASDVTIDENTTPVQDVDAVDPDGDTVEFSITGGADAALFEIDPATGQLDFINAPDFENPLDDDGDNVYEVEVTATDPGNLSDSQLVNVTVADVNEAPDVTGPATIDVDENVTGVIGDFDATDPDAGDNVTFSLTGDDAALFDIDPATGELSFITPPDFENPGDADGDNEYEVTVVGTDNGGLTDEQDVVITVGDVLEADGIVDGEEDGELMGPDYDDADGPTDGGGDIIDGPDGIDDVIEGNGGDDTIDSGLGDDTVDGGAGDDVFVITEEGNGIDNDVITGGETEEDSGGDTIDTTDIDDDLDVVFTDPEEGTITDGTDTTTFEEIENLQLGGGDDSVTGSDGGENVDGGGGDDTLEGEGGDDTLSGGEGEDDIDGGDGDDVLDGGEGDDTITGGDGADTVTDLEGDNVIDTSGTIALPDDKNGDGFGFAPYAGLPPVPEDTAPGDDADSVTTGDGNDSITTGDDADTISSGGGNDTIDSGIDNDSVDGGAGADLITTGEGADTVDGGDGNDTIFGGLGPSFPDSLNIPDDGSNPFGPDPDTENGRDLLDGGRGNDLIFGEDDDDTLIGGIGDDTLDGGIDDDSLQGDIGFDSLIGGQGDDTLDGGRGRDTLEGGTGDDVFIEAGNDGADTIVDFGVGNTGPIDDGDQTNNDFVDLSQFYNDTTLADVNANATNPANQFNDPLSMLRADAEDGRLDGVINGEDLSPFIGGIDLTIQNGGDFVTGSDLTFDNTNVACFVRGTQIATRRGSVAIEDLKAGDEVITMDHGFQKIRWIGSTSVPATGALAPVLIRKGAMGNERDLRVSPQHRMLVRGWHVELMFGQKEALVPAKALINDETVFPLEGGTVDYFHMMFDRHELVYAEGVPSESFHPGHVGLGSFAEDTREEILTLFPELRADAGGYSEHVRPSLKVREAKVLAENPELLKQ
ncbi:MAG: Hint domain-containing protein [Pseudomonadota bacterium]